MESYQVLAPTAPWASSAYGLLAMTATGFKMTLKLFNTLSGTLEEFKPIQANEVRMYTCGPTVYDFAHIGNFRTFIFQDLLKRYLGYKGFKVRHVMNITDVDDKTIAGAIREKSSLVDYTQKYTDAFLEDLRALGIEPANEVLFATQTIPEMIEMIKVLITKDHAYVKDGSVYFRVASFKDYGKLSKKKLEGNIVGARVEQDEYEKEEGADFALWKVAKDEDIKVGAAWDSPWGRGRPGWHIECSTMSLKAFNQETFDIHTGGEDLIFPHHENEIAQSESCTGKKFVNYWLHARHLLVDGKKMSKKEQNFFTLRDLLSKKMNPLAIRYALISGHYRTQFNFTLEGIQASAESIRRISNLWADSLLDGMQTDRKKLSDSPFAQDAKAFEDALDDDLNVPKALAVIFDVVKKCYSRQIKYEAGELKRFLKEVNDVLGVFDFGEVKLPAEIETLKAKYTSAKQAKNYDEVDALRSQVKKLGFRFEDARDGIKVKKIS